MCPNSIWCSIKLLPKEINGVRIIGIDVPGFGVPTHAEAKDVLAGAMLNYARKKQRKDQLQHLFQESLIDQLSLY